MTTLAESLVSSSSRPLTVRKRPDLTANRQFYQGTAYRVVKEPVGLQYFRFCADGGRLEAMKRFEAWIH